MCAPAVRVRNDVPTIPPHAPEQDFESLYVLEKKLASGGSGTVYSGTYLPTSHPVAVKVMIVPADESAEAFWNQREIEIMKTVR